MPSRLRREPFRLLFPLAVLVAWVGVSPWMLFGTGFMRAWPGTFHALTMTQSFLLAVAVGFLSTMIPRRTGSAPISTLGLGLAATSLATIPLAVAGDRLALAEGAYLVALVVMLGFALTRMRARASSKPIPPSFVFIPAGLLAGLVGAGLLFSFSVAASPQAWMLAPGRSLVEEGVLLAFVLGLTPMLSPIILHDSTPEAPIASRRVAQWRLHALLALLLLSSFAIQHAVSERGGLLLRGLVVALQMLFSARLLEAPRAPGVHRRLYRLALLFVPLGPLTAAVRPALRTACLHLTFIGGFSLMVFAVSFHVAYLHTGREAQARRSSPWVVMVGALTLLATAARFFAERFSSHYFEALTVASSLWVAGAVLWGVHLTWMVTLPPRDAETARG